MKKIYVLIIMLLSLSACTQNRENMYCYSESKNALIIAEGLSKDAINDEYAIPTCTSRKANIPAAIIPPGSVLTNLHQ